MPKPRTKKRFPRLNLSRFKTYAQLKAYAMAHPGEFSPEQGFAIVERMRQLRFGYKPGELKWDRKKIKIECLTMEEFRAKREKEDEEEIRKYGPR
jgi:hypothetical protein